MSIPRPAGNAMRATCLRRVHALLAESALLLTTLREDRQSAERVPQTFRLIRRYEELCGAIYTFRELIPAHDPERRGIEDRFAQISHALVTVQDTGAEQANARWSDRYREIWYREFPLFIFCMAVFVGSVVIGLALALFDPEYLPLFLPQPLMERILDHSAWFEEIRKNPFADGLSIAYNNIKVAILAFAMGALLGLGGLYIVAFNGVLFGAIVGYCLSHGFEGPLARFVAGHGPLELSIIVASGFASLLYGRAFLMRPIRDIPLRLQRGGRDAFLVLSGIVPWLLLAAFLEVFVSPWEYLSGSAKLLVGIIAAVAFWWWTFKQDPRQKSLKIAQSF